jgi:hypothetical protein
VASATEFFNACGDIIADRNQNYGEQERQLVVDKNMGSSPPTYEITEKQGYTANMPGVVNAAGPAKVTTEVVPGNWTGRIVKSKPEIRSVQCPRNDVSITLSSKRKLL